jgi:hypothetical protein
VWCGVVGVPQAASNGGGRSAGAGRALLRALRMRMLRPMFRFPDLAPRSSLIAHPPRKVGTVTVIQRTRTRVSLQAHQRLSTRTRTVDHIPMISQVTFRSHRWRAILQLGNSRNAIAVRREPLLERSSRFAHTRSNHVAQPYRSGNPQRRVGLICRVYLYSGTPRSMR